jgi:hypothetical protein
MPKRTIPKVGNYTKIQVVSFVQLKLKSNDDWAKRACETLYAQQTQQEKKNHISSGANTWGFSRNDSPLLTHLACKQRQNRLTLEDVKVLQVKLPKYARQLVCLAHEKDKCKNLKTHLDYYYRNQKKKLPF